MGSTGREGGERRERGTTGAYGGYRGGGTVRGGRGEGSAGQKGCVAVHSWS